MRSIVLLVGAGLLLASCSDSDVTSSTNSCAAKLYQHYNPNDIKQCSDVCMKCSNGTPITCSTSCNLKGAR